MLIFILINNAGRKRLHLALHLNISRTVRLCLCGVRELIRFWIPSHDKINATGYTTSEPEYKTKADVTSCLPETGGGAWKACFFVFITGSFSWHKQFPPPSATSCAFVDFVVLPPGHGRSVTDFWGWDAHQARLRCPDDVWVVKEKDVVLGGVSNLNSTNLPRPWSPRESSPSRKIPTVEPGIEPGTSWLVVRDSEH